MESRHAEAGGPRREATPLPSRSTHAGWAQRHDPVRKSSLFPWTPGTAVRPHVAGKFLFLGERKLYVRGATYGTFRPLDGCEYPAQTVVERDFALMASNGINALRTYTAPPLWLLDAARRHGLWVLAGLPAERYIGHLADGKKAGPDMEELVAGWMADSVAHPAVLGYSVGNEISSSVARWHGPGRVSAYLERLYEAVKAIDPEALVTYANYPSTEYLTLPFLDFVCFNVFLESRERFDAYLARLQRLAGDRPLLMGELGLDAYRNGDERQSRALEWQIRTSFEAGCAGLFVYSWTDEWHRGGEDVHDWAFGLTRRDREPKPALAAARRAFTEAPFSGEIAWPRISVVVCTYNGARTLDETLAALERVDYPDVEVIVINDGSTDTTEAIARRHSCRLVSTENRGLSHARNLGLSEATGSIVAYLDDDAYPDPHWLRYLALAFLRSEHGGVGGPNLPPVGDGPTADCVANAPGNPVHVLTTDREAEHIPGCNMAFRKAALEAVGGFDSQFRVAGDDVDLCWRLTDAGFTIGFSPAAVVWHHRRGSIRAFLKQQMGYGRAEGMLERKWPARHDASGDIAWSGRIYGRGRIYGLGRRRGRIYQGVWGTAPFQSLYEPAASGWVGLMQSPAWYLLLACLGLLSLLGLDWPPLRLALLPFAFGAGLTAGQAWKSAKHARFHGDSVARWGAFRLRALTALLYVAQPLARIWGRWTHAVRHPRGRRPWRLRDLRSSTTGTWTGERQEGTARIAAVEVALREEGAVPRRGGDFDRWDLEARVRSFGAARVLVGVEEHAHRHQLIRVRLWPTVAPGIPWLAAGLLGLALGAAWAEAAVATAALGLTLAIVVGRTVIDMSAALGAVRRALGKVGLEG